MSKIWTDRIKAISLGVSKVDSLKYIEPLNNIYFESKLLRSFINEDVYDPVIGCETSPSRKADRLLLFKGKIYFSVSSLNIFIQEFLDTIT